MQAMEKYPEEARVQGHGCRALPGLSKTVDGLDRVWLNFGCRLAYGAMRQHPGDVDVQSYGCHVLGLLKHSRGAWMVWEDMDKHPHSAAVQHQGIRALAVFLTSGPTSPKVRADVMETS